MKQSLARLGCRTRTVLLELQKKAAGDVGSLRSRPTHRSPVRPGCQAVQSAPPVKWPAARLAVSAARLCRIGPAAQNHLWAQLLSSLCLVDPVPDGGPVPPGPLANEVRAGPARPPSCLLTLAFCPPGRGRQEVPDLGRKSPSSGRTPRVGPALRSRAFRRQLKGAVQLGGAGTVIESKCGVVTGSGPCWPVASDRWRRFLHVGQTSFSC